MREREISLMDLAVQILLQWRKIAAAMLAGAVVAGVFCCVQSYRAQKALEAKEIFESVQTDWTELEKELEEGLTDVQIQNVKAVQEYEAFYQSKQKYRRQSALMQMDSNQVNRMELTFYVSADSRQLAAEIERAYEDIVQSGSMYAYAAKKTGLDSADMAELLTLSRGSGALAQGSCTFRVRIIHSVQDVCEGIARAAEEFLRKEQEELEKSMGSHQLELIHESCAEGADLDLLERQKNALNDLMIIADTIAQRKAAFTEEENKYYGFLAGIDAQESGDTDGEEAADGEEGLSVSGGSGPSGISAAYILFGAVLAAFAYIFFLFLEYVMSRKICAADQLQQIYGIPQFGAVPKQGGKKKWLGFVDAWILSLQGQSRHRFAREEAVQLSAVSVRMAAVKEGLDSVCLVGCNLDQGALEICDAVKEQLAQEGICCRILDNILYDAKAMYGLGEAKGAVLVERAHVTLYNEISQELDLLGRQKVTVLGGIIAE